MRACCAGLAPDTFASVYAAKQREAKGLFQVYYHNRPAYALRHLSMVVWLLYSAQAWSNQWAAVLMPVWLAVPLVQIIFNVFPLIPNRCKPCSFLPAYPNNKPSKAQEILPFLPALLMGLH